MQILAEMYGQMIYALYWTSGIGGLDRNLEVQKNERARKVALLKY